ncbi:MAG: hypothetical protein DRQ89_10585 [Epsilonproteobacteria bacterium]|nr:MAG: hypothetical protein DRQ89_10585 [Campylobacterota bacterium]
MNFFKRWPLILVSFFFLTSVAQAGFLIEPYVGYGFGITGEDPNVEASRDTEVTYNGFDAGMRIGFRMSNFTFGVDGDYMSEKADYELSTGTAHPERQKYNFGAFAGLIFGEWSFRATWYWDSTWKFKSDDLISFNPGMKENISYKTTGEAFGLGIGWQFMEYFALNIDYRMFFYSELDGATVEKFNPGEIVLSFGFPFDLGKMITPAPQHDPWMD